jgi:hypothetical protein
VVDALTSSPRSHGESATAAATGSGTTRTCKVTRPYAWALANPSQRQYDDQLLRYWGWFSFRAGSEEQYSLSLSLLDTRKVPANGAYRAHGRHHTVNIRAVLKWTRLFLQILQSQCLSR